MKKTIFTFLIILRIIPILSQTQCYINDIPGAAREKNNYFYHLDLDIKLLAKESTIEGTATYSFNYLRKEIDTMFLDAIEFDVSKITINNEDVAYKVDSAGITIYLPKSRRDSSKLHIAYTCMPKRGIYFINWNNPDPNCNRQIWTQGQGIDNRHWIPGFDHVSDLLTVNSTINFDAKYPLVSNGKFIRADMMPDGTKSWKYEMSKPHALYLIMIATGNYDSKTIMTKSGISLEQFYYPKNEKHFEATYEKSAEMMDWFENEIGIPFPWGKVYRNVPTQDFLFGAMENTTSTIFTDNMHQDTRSALERPYISVNAHELAHQWFGDLITERYATHHWLHESFATHYSKKFMASVYGQDKMDQIRKGELEASFNAGKQNSLAVANSQSGSARHYPKGSFVLDMLRNELGNENYRASITNYLKNHSHKNVETNDLIASIYETTGRNVQWFFDQWVYRGGEPKLDVVYTQKDSVLSIDITQSQEIKNDVSYFRLPMKLLILHANKSIQWVPIDIKDYHSHIDIPLHTSNQIVAAILDPDMQFLRKINYPKNGSNDIKIINSSPSYLSKLEALERMTTVPWNSKKQDYLNLYHATKDIMTKQEIIGQIPEKDASEISIDLLIHGLQDAHHLVRRKAISKVSIQHPVIEELLVKALKDSSYINIEMACNKLLELYDKNNTNYLDSIKDLSGISYNLALFYHQKNLKLAPIGSEKYLNSIQKLKYMASPSVDFRARFEAIRILMQHNILDQSIAKNLILGAVYFHPQIKAISRQYLTQINKTNKKLLDQSLNEVHFETEKDKKLFTQFINQLP